MTWTFVKFRDFRVHISLVPEESLIKKKPLLGMGFLLSRFSTPNSCFKSCWLAEKAPHVISTNHQPLKEKLKLNLINGLTKLTSLLKFNTIVAQFVTHFCNKSKCSKGVLQESSEMKNLKLCSLGLWHCKHNFVSMQNKDFFFQTGPS